MVCTTLPIVAGGDLDPSRHACAALPRRCPCQRRDLWLVPVTNSTHWASNSLGDEKLNATAPFPPLLRRSSPRKRSHLSAHGPASCTWMPRRLFSPWNTRWPSPLRWAVHASPMRNRLHSDSAAHAMHSISGHVNVPLPPHTGFLTVTTVSACYSFSFATSPVTLRKSNPILAPRAE